MVDPTPEQMAWDDWARRHRKRARFTIGAWAVLMFTALGKVFTDGILPYLRLRASTADSSDTLFRAGLEAAKAGGGMFLILLAAGAAALILGRSLERSRDLLGERPADRSEDLDAGH